MITFVFPAEIVFRKVHMATDHGARISMPRPGHVSINFPFPVLRVSLFVRVNARLKARAWWGENV